MNPYKLNYTVDQKKDLYIDYKNVSDILLDEMTNAEYLTYTAEASYTAIVLLTKVLSQDLIKYIFKYTFYRNYASELSERTIRRLTNAIEICDLPKFKFIYDVEYMQYYIFNWFEYDDETPGYKRNLYSLCTCSCFEKEPIKIHRHLYIQQCFCENGKRYQAFNLICNIASDNIVRTEKVSPFFCCEDQSDDYNQMVNYIISSGPIIKNYKPLIINH